MQKQFEITNQRRTQQNKQLNNKDVMRFQQAVSVLVSVDSLNVDTVHTNRSVAAKVCTIRAQGDAASCQFT